MAKGTADFYVKNEYSIIGPIATNANGKAIDCLGYTEALLFYGQAVLAGGADPTSNVKWQETTEDPASKGNPLAAGWTDIAGAAFATVESHLANVVAVVNLATGATLTLLAQPTAPARIMVTIIDTTTSITAGSVTVAGTRYPANQAEQSQYGANGDVPVTEVIQFTSAAASPGTSKKTNTIFKTVTSIKTGVVTGVAGTVAFTVLGGAGDETIKVGSDNSGEEVPHVGSINLINRKRFIRSVNTKTNTPTGEFVVGATLFRSMYKPILHKVPREFRVL